jgi:hypothetical protein
MMLLAYFVGDPRWKGIETDMITGPAWTLEGRTFAAATSTIAPVTSNDAFGAADDTAAA